jgi:hypothetical protein
VRHQEKLTVEEQKHKKEVNGYLQKASEYQR